jgi:hypothetical protein
VVSDPFRRPQDLYASIISPIGSFVDKAKVIPREGGRKEEGGGIEEGVEREEGRE